MDYIIFILCILIIISYVFFRNDIFSPSFLFFLGYFISALFAFYSTAIWDMSITLQQIMILCLGWIGFFIAEFLINFFDNKQSIKMKNEDRVPLSIIKVQPVKIFIVVSIDLLITVVLYKNIASIAAIGNATDANLIASFKENSLDNSLSSATVQLLKITKGMAFVFLFVFVNNMVADSSKLRIRLKKNLILLIPCVFYCIHCFLKGGRFTVIAFIIGALFLYFLFIEYKSNWKYKIKLKTIIKLIVLSVVVMYVFWAIKELVGRTSQDTVIDYLARYLGGSYELLSLYLKNSPDKGFETFGYMVQSINKLFGSNIPYTTYHEFRFSSSGILIGNVYTGMRNYYNDCGYIGVFVFSFLLSLIFNLMYKILKTSRNIYKHVFLLIFYSSVIYTVFFHFFVEYFFARISVGYIVELIIMYICYRFVMRVRLIIRD